MTVAELGFRMSSAEFSDWIEYHDVEPFGPRQGDLHAGTVTAAVYNVNRDPKRRPEPFTAADFFPDRSVEPAKPLSIVDKVRAWADRHNALFGKGKRTD